MAVQFSCGDLGIACKVVLRAETEDELVIKIAEHVLTAHGVDIREAGMLEEIRSELRSSIGRR